MLDIFLGHKIEIVCLDSHIFNGILEDYNFEFLKINNNNSFILISITAIKLIKLATN